MTTTMTTTIAAVTTAVAVTAKAIINLAIVLHARNAVGAGKVECRGVRGERGQSDGQADGRQEFRSDRHFRKPFWIAAQTSLRSWLRFKNGRNVSRRLRQDTTG